MSIKYYELFPRLIPEAKCFHEWDTVQGFVVAANDETEARKIAAEHVGSEEYFNGHINPWLDDKLTTCAPLSRDEPGLILRDFNAG